MKKGLDLEYALGEGWLSPWLDGLRAGVAVASVCAVCDKAHFPPLRVCPTCRVPSEEWRRLSGGATIRFRTRGSDGDFAMAHFDGAEGAAIARADALSCDAARAFIAPSSEGPPTLVLAVSEHIT